jgi:hypothetical protein
VTDANHGLFGEMLAAIAPETEADPAGVLLGWLACFGNVVGRGAWQRVGPRLHHPALYVGIVGLTSDAKGDGWAAALWPFKQVEPEWASACIANGVGSGEGLIERIADDQTVLDRAGEAVLLPGAADKRMLVRLPELSRCFKLGRRENATLSEHLREAWDGEPIHVPNRKGNALSTTGYSVSVCGDVTPGVVRKLLESGTEGFDGFANRFLWAVVRSGRDLPNGGDIAVLGPFLDRLQAALSFAKTAGEMRRDAEAEALWGEVYPALKRSGDSVPHTDRARPHVLRLSMVFALTDCSAVIGAKHLRAALAVWERCRAAAQTLFGTPLVNAKLSNPLWLSLLNAITLTPGVNRTALREVAGHKTPAEEIEAALSYLKASGLAHSRMLQAEGGGRPAECWWPGPAPEPPSGWGGSVVPGADAGREGTNSPASGVSSLPEVSALATDLGVYAGARADPVLVFEADAAANPLADALAARQPPLPDPDVPVVAPAEAGAGAEALTADDLAFIAELDATAREVPPPAPG